MHLNELNDMLALSHVPRWAIVRHVVPQAVSDHVFRTMAIFNTLAHRLDVEFTLSDFLAVLKHDIDEARTGDIPTPAKSQLNVPPWDYEFSSPEVRLIFNLADLIEAFTFIEKHGKGAHAGRVAMALRKKIAELSDIHYPTVNSVIDAITYETGR